MQTIEWKEQYRRSQLIFEEVELNTSVICQFTDFQSYLFYFWKGNREEERIGEAVAQKRKNNQNDNPRNQPDKIPDNIWMKLVMEHVMVSFNWKREALALVTTVFNSNTWNFEWVHTADLLYIKYCLWPLEFQFLKQRCEDA